MKRPFKHKRVVGPFISSPSLSSNDNTFLEVILDKSQTVSLMLDENMYGNMQQKRKLENSNSGTISNVGTDLAIDILSSAGISGYDNMDKLEVMFDPVVDSLNREILVSKDQTVSLIYEVSSLSPDELADLIISVRDLDVTINTIRWV